MHHQVFQIVLIYRMSLRHLVKRFFDSNQRAPYVDNFFTYSYLDNMPSSLNGAKIDPDYLYYNQEYELAYFIIYGS